jgi:hypothetical protein
MNGRLLQIRGERASAEVSDLLDHHLELIGGILSALFCSLESDNFVGETPDRFATRGFRRPAQRHCTPDDDQEASPKDDDQSGRHGPIVE